METHLLEIVSGGRLNLDYYNIDGNSIKRLWTVYDEELMWNNNPHKVKSLEKLPLIHLKGVFLEDKIHDWRIVNKNTLYYYTRVVEIGTAVKIILEIK